VSLDSYLNLQLAGTVEYMHGKPTGELARFSSGDTPRPPQALSGAATKAP